MIAPAPAAPATSGTRRYNLVFADGKKAIALDMNNEGTEETIRRITAMFGAHRVRSIAPA